MDASGRKKRGKSYCSTPEETRAINYVWHNYDDPVLSSWCVEKNCSCCYWGSCSRFLGTAALKWAHLTLHLFQTLCFPWKISSTFPPNRLTSCFLLSSSFASSSGHTLLHLLNPCDLFVRPSLLWLYTLYLSLSTELKGGAFQQNILLSSLFTYCYKSS